MKTLVMKTPKRSSLGEKAFKEALLEYRNTPHYLDGKSEAESQCDQPPSSQSSKRRLRHISSGSREHCEDPRSTIKNMGGIGRNREAPSTKQKLPDKDEHWSPEMAKSEVPPKIRAPQCEQRHRSRRCQFWRIPRTKKEQSRRSTSISSKPMKEPKRGMRENRL
eukprot:maker-scaffold480_size160630-snap-gene-0.29 protein:Tk05818 transcript:maker-scaffold480_size160630-snap-gene-0.29-mRNA-1 annotation:"hypothetical protein"